MFSMGDDMRFKVLFFVVFMTFLSFAEEGSVLCENEAGKCTANKEKDFLECVCENRFDSDNWGLSEENITVERCKERLEEICGTELTTVDEACENKIRMEVCYDFAFYVMPCLTKISFSQEQVKEAREGGWNDYAKEVVSCCYVLYWDDEYYGDNNKTESFENTSNCMKQDDATCESCSISGPTEDPVSENDDDAQNDSEKSENKSETGSGCSLVVI